VSRPWKRRLRRLFDLGLAGKLMQGHVLIIDDDASTCTVLEAALQDRSFGVRAATTPAEGLSYLEEHSVDVVLVDMNMPNMSGADLCTQLLVKGPDMPVVVMTAYGSVETAVAAIRAGAYDFVTKPFDIDDLCLRLERAIRDRALREEVKRLRQNASEPQGFQGILGASSQMEKVFQLVSRVAESDTSVLITGESGTGKERVARALHECSVRKGGPLVAINCAAMPEPLLESELFGHLRGAFTDARQARTGLFVQASGGTLLLDEIGEMPAGMQAKLLRALQERKVRPVGGDVEVPFDARILATTNRDLETEVEDRRFREDLFYRINVVRIHVPPLRVRGNDILLLARHYLDRFGAENGKQVTGMSSACAERLLVYRWPGNVRELQNCMEHAVALTRFDQVGLDDLPERIRNFRVARIVVETEDPSEILPMEEVERRYIQHVLEAVGGNKTMAARTLGFDRRTLYRKLDAYAAAPAPEAAAKDVPLAVSASNGAGREGLTSPQSADAK
jgi:DNA-binding NtrC family response regulator